MVVFGIWVAGCSCNSPDPSVFDDGGADADVTSDAGPPVDGGPGVDGGSPPADAGPAVCGDRVVTAPEECDDGNTTAGDGCSATCTIEVSATCGDGTVDRPTEECDDGNTADGDGCSARCLVEAPTGCGDGTIDFAAGEECDDGNTLPGDGCSPTCQLEAVGAFCGDSTMDTGEVCDDGNIANGDGCNPTCNLTGTTSAFVGMAGMAARTDGTGTAGRIAGLGTLAADRDTLWFAEAGGGAGSSLPGALRRIDIATATITTVATLPAPGAEGIATDGTGTVWIAGNDGSGPAIFSIDVTGTPPFTPTRVTGSASCSGAGCYADGPPGTATFGGVRGLAWYGGYLWIVDPEAATIRRLDPATGDVVTVAGMVFARGFMDGIGSLARFTSPRYLVSDGSGTLFISDTNGASIRALSTATNAVTTFAGNGTAGYVDGIGAAARIHRPRGIVSDGTSIYWAEFNAHTIRQGVVATQDVSTLVGMPMSAGYLEGVGTAARLDGPWGVAFHFPSNSLFFVDTNNVIRRIQ